MTKSHRLTIRLSPYAVRKLRKASEVETEVTHALVTPSSWVRSLICKELNIPANYGEDQF